jgi:hypothetical protein
LAGAATGRYDAAVAAEPFAFAQVNARTVADGRVARDSLARRLGIEAEPQLATLRASPAWEALLTYCIEGPLNIDWYDRRIAAWRRQKSIFVTLCIVITIGVVALLLWRNSTDSMVAQLSASVAALLACVRILAGAADVTTQLGGFWRARADLKEQFLTFEHGWHGHVIAANGAVADGFETALWQEITNARHVVRAERDTYFSTFKAPADLVAIAGGSLDALLGRVQQVQTLRAAPSPLSQAVTDARTKLDQAHGDRAAHERMLQLLAIKPPTLSDEAWRKMREDAESGRTRAEADIARYSELLRSSAKAATLNPT